MNNIIHALELLLRNFSELFIIIIEFLGGIVLVFGCFYIFYNFIFPAKRENLSTKLRIKLGRFTSLALELFLAAEILKTIYIRELSELYIVAAIIVLRVLMAFVVHWEMGLDLKELKNEVKKRHSNLNK